VAVVCLASVLMLEAATRIDDPKTFVSEVFRRLIASQAKDRTYEPPEDIYTARLAKLIRDDRRKAHGEVGCLDFVFWVNGQDWVITDLAVTSTDEGEDRKTVIAKFRNTGDPQEIHFDFRRVAGRWLLDDAHSLMAEKWTLSQILKCTP
jgi:hypothetical protein